MTPSHHGTVIDKTDEFYSLPAEDDAMLFQMDHVQYRPSQITSSPRISSLHQDQHAIKNESILNSIEENTFKDRAFGCILGAFVSDSCGSYNEFSTKVATEDFMNNCMQMKGGGPWNLCAG